MTPPSNLLILMSDEHQARALSCAGHFVQTPNLDRLAARGVRFSNAYTPSPICVPARASFATGLYPHQTGHWDNSMPYRGTPPSWGHRLQEKGIRVESIGKLHYRDPEDPVGFEAMHVPMMVKDGVGMVFASARKVEERVAAPGRMLGQYIGPGESTYTRYDQEVVAQTQDWLHGTAQSDQPWCLY
ncbi:MAG: sulfatase-like hydrolase/transferase, partial [Pseudomonadota bacterium]